MPVYFYGAILVVAVFSLLLVSFIAGVWTYGHVFQHFQLKAEERAQARLVKILAAERAAKQKVEDVRKRIVEQYGPDLSAKHQAIVDEEIEKALMAR